MQYYNKKSNPMLTLEQIKAILPDLDNVAFQLENGTFVPEYFHVTEIGRISRHFIDCGGTMRQEHIINFQLWNADDYDHRLKPGKLLHIIQLSEEKLGMDNAVVEVEYQSDTIGRYDLDFNGKHFILRNKQTACLAQETCGIPLQQQHSGNTTCTPASGCCQGI